MVTLAMNADPPPTAGTIEIRCASRNLSDHPVTNGSAQSCNINLEDEIAVRGIRLRTPELDPQCLSERCVVSDSKTLQIT